MDDSERNAKQSQALIHIYLTRKMLAWGFVGIAVCTAVYGLFSDTLTMTAYYPSPQGVYWRLWSTADAVFGRDQLANPLASSVVQIGGDNTKGPSGTYNKQTGSALTVYGNTTISPNTNFPGSGNLTIQGNTDIGGNASIGKFLSAGSANFSGAITASQGGIILPTAVSGDPCVGTIGADANGNLYGCSGGHWQQSSASTSGSRSVQIVSGTNPACPAGYTASSYEWSSKTCATSGINTTNEYLNGGSCTTTSMFSPNPPSCTYHLYGAYCTGRNCSGWGYIDTYVTCTADAYTKTECLPN